ncbi:MAG: primosomal protein N' [Candidatus Manganitrophaceae bacterium]
MSQSHFAHFVEVVFPEIEGTFHYLLPPSLSSMRLMPGARLWVPFGRGQRIAFFLRSVDRPDVQEVKTVFALLEDKATIPPPLFKLLHWISDYYLSPLGAVIKGAFPSEMQVTVRRRFHLTEAGRKINIDEEKISPLHRKMLALLLKTGELTEAELRKRLGEKSVVPSLASLKKKNWIEVSFQVDPPAVRKKHRSLLSLKGDPIELPSVIDSLKKKAPQQAAVLEALGTAGGTLPLGALSEPLRAAAKRLEEKGIINRASEETRRIPSRGGGFPSEGPILLNPAQQSAVDRIVDAVEARAFSAFLLHGVTGSGKTEVYLRAIEKTVEQKRGAMILVPEIALTAQLVARFHRRFGEAVALLHSGLSGGERYDEWSRIREGKAQIVIGVRSALFAPLEEVGIIIVDEEHDPSYKQEEGVRYHARDMALVRGKQSNAVVVLGSATPSFESFHNGQIGKYHPLRLPGRIDARPLPMVTVIDLRVKEEWVRPYLTQKLVAAIQKRLDDCEQTILFINRRGFAPSLLCIECGRLPECIRCSVSLTLHKKSARLVCHYCGYALPPPTACAQCGGVRLVHLGIGTEQVEEEIRKLFPSARVARIDRDVAQKKETHQEIFGAMAQREIDILIGTQMIAKGHDFPGVTLVGVLCADLSLHFPDFRAAERTFQLLAQVAGRAGRGDRPGEVMIQTFQPDHEVIRSVLAHDDLGFYEREIALRKATGYPPFSRLTLFLFQHADEMKVADRAAALATEMKKVLGSLKKNGVKPEAELLGPAPAPLTRLRGEYRYQILLKGKDPRQIAAVTKKSLKNWDAMERKGVRLEINVDPQNFA